MEKSNTNPAAIIRSKPVEREFVWRPRESQHSIMAPLLRLGRAQT